MRGRVPAARALGRAGRWVSRALLEPPQPLVALEVRPRALSAVRLTRERGRLGLGAAAVGELSEGSLEVSLTRANVVDPEAFQASLRTVLERAGALSGGPIALVLPDPTVRVAVLVPGVPRGRPREVEETLRFRLHKALPFDVRGARLAWEAAGGEQTLVAIAPEEVVRGYEEALAALGFQPGLVVTAGLALSAAVAEESDADRLLVNWDDGYVSFLLLRGSRLLLVRTLPGEDGAEAVARQARSTLQFHNERLSGAPVTEAIVRPAALPAETALEVIERALRIPTRLLAPWAGLGSADTGPAAQAVAGAAACVLRSAA